MPSSSHGKKCHEIFSKKYPHNATSFIPGLGGSIPGELCQYQYSLVDDAIAC